MSSPRIITRADDFGVSPGTNDAILECLDAGFIRNVGVMAPAPFLSHRWEELLERQDSFCPGLHATLNSEWAALRWGPVLPAAQVTSLVEADGTFHRKTHILNERGKLREMMAEIRAQLGLLRKLGLRPRYLDCHMMFIWIDGVADALTELCLAEGLLFANGPGFASISLPLKAEAPLTAREIAGAVDNLARENTETLPFWLFHPARRDSVSEKFYPDPAQPSTAVASARHYEYATLTDRQTLGQWGVHTLEYCGRK